MEILAIVVLGVSTLLGLSTTKRQPQRKTNKRYDDADWAFTEAYDLNGSKVED